MCLFVQYRTVLYEKFTERVLSSMNENKDIKKGRDKEKKQYKKPSIESTSVYETGALACNKLQGICFPNKMT